MPKPSPHKPTVVIGILGTTLDAAKGARRWERWRPTVSLCQHDDFVVDRLELIHDRQADQLATQIEEDIASVSPETTLRRHYVDMENPWDFEEVYGKLHDFARKYKFKPDEEDYLIHITTGSHVAQICNFLLTESGYFPAKLIQTSPPRWKKDGAGLFSIIDLDLSKYDRLASRFEREHQDAVTSLKDGIETRNARFNALIDRIEHVAIRTTDPILLTGPTGAGKSKLATRIYDLRQDLRVVHGPMVTVNCATLRGDSAMSTLFGHTKGAFTGAITERSGLLKKADKGLLFLDEIGELGLDEQAMLLRAIEDKVFMPMGSDRDISSDFQLIAGTNRDLMSDVRNGTFRDDLYARINLWTFELPALKDRPEDIEPNVDFELDRFGEQRNHSVRFNAEARELFLSFACSEQASWQGNFRDLNAALTRMATLATGGRITEDIVLEEQTRLTKSWESGFSGGPNAALSLALSRQALEEMDLFDKLQLQAVLDSVRDCNSISEAGRKLFAQSRAKRSTTNDADRLRKYLSKHGLDWSQLKSIYATP